jgi:hypothetical protein
MRFVLAIVVGLLAVPAHAQHDRGPIEVLTPAGARKTVHPQWRWIDPNPLGEDLNPVRVHGQPGRQAYLSRLVCPEGGAPVFSQIGSTRGGPYGSPLDIVMVTCVNIARRVHFDVFHVAEYVERRPIEGFAIRDP